MFKQKRVTDIFEDKASQKTFVYKKIFSRKKYLLKQSAIFKCRTTIITCFNRVHISKRTLACSTTTYRLSL